MIAEWIADRSGRILGFKVTPVTEPEIMEAVALSREHVEQLIIASMNLHGLYVASVSPEFVELHELDQTLVHTDGSAPIYLAKAEGLPVGFEHRTGVHDWLPVLAEEAGAHGWRIFCLGSQASTNAKAVERLRQDSGGGDIAGRNGFFDVDSAAEVDAILQEIDDFDPDIVVVGLGMGRQEEWILNHRERLGARVVITCGACLEYMAGEMPLPPKWFGPTGLFMVVRVVTRPRRYAFRYLVEPGQLLFELARSGRLSAFASRRVRSLTGRPDRGDDVHGHD